MSIRPLHDRMVVRPLEVEERTLGGILIPDTAKEEPMEGVIIAAGPGLHAEGGGLLASEVRVDQRILFGKWSGTEIKIDGEDLLILCESDIMGVFQVSGSRHKGTRKTSAKTRAMARRKKA
jgi:chaperonin GroES